MQVPKFSGDHEQHAVRCVQCAHIVLAHTLSAQQRLQSRIYRDNCKKKQAQTTHPPTSHTWLLQHTNWKSRGTSATRSLMEAGVSRRRAAPCWQTNVTDVPHNSPQKPHPPARPLHHESRAGSHTQSTLGASALHSFPRAAAQSRPQPALYGTAPTILPNTDCMPNMHERRPRGRHSVN